MTSRHRLLAAALAAVCSVTAYACGSAEERPAVAIDRPTTRDVDRPAPSRPRIVVLGDSLTAGLGLAPAQAYPALLQTRLDAEHFDYEVVNAGVSGDTSAGGLSRLDWALEGDVRILILALGGNDGLRGLPVDELDRNLSAIITRAQGRGIRVLLAGMEAPPNFGRAYVESFRRIYPALAARFHLDFVPFLLKGVAGIESLNQPDGIHPTAVGAQTVADTVWTILRPMLQTS